MRRSTVGSERTDKVCNKVCGAWRCTRVCSASFGVDSIKLKPLSRPLPTSRGEENTGPPPVGCYRVSCVHRLWPSARQGDVCRSWLLPRNHSPKAHFEISACLIYQRGRIQKSDCKPGREGHFHQFNRSNPALHDENHQQHRHPTWQEQSGQQPENGARMLTVPQCEPRTGGPDRQPIKNQRQQSANEQFAKDDAVSRADG